MYIRNWMVEPAVIRRGRGGNGQWKSGIECDCAGLAVLSWVRTCTIGWPIRRLVPIYLIRASLFPGYIGSPIHVLLNNDCDGLTKTNNTNVAKPCSTIGPLGSGPWAIALTKRETVFVYWFELHAVDEMAVPSCWTRIISFGCSMHAFIFGQTWGNKQDKKKTKKKTKGASVNLTKTSAVWAQYHVEANLPKCARLESAVQSSFEWQ